MHTIDGTHIHTVNDLYDAFATTLSFPAYFGRNWDAFEECLGDYLTTHPDTPVTITAADHLLDLATPDDRATLAAIIAPHRNQTASGGATLVLAGRPD